MRVIRGTNSHLHVSMDIVNEFERIILSDFRSIDAKGLGFLQKKIALYLFKIRRKFGFPDLSLNYQFRFRNALADLGHHFVIMMGWDLNKCLNYFISSNHYKSIYLFDAWLKDHDQISYFTRFFHIDYLFISSSQACNQLKEQLKPKNVFWIPEALNPEDYNHFPVDQKQIDVLALGRKYDKHHNLIINELESKGIKYLYEKKKGEIVFPTRQEFITGLAKTKISICVPSSITHPERSGNIETMTVRYLQSMASKCLVLGHAPKEMIELFGYNPVIEIDFDNPVGQIVSLLQNYHSYTELIEKNYFEVVNNHTWQRRWEQIKSIYQKNSGQND